VVQRDQGYGFIQRKAAAKDVFVHISASSAPTEQSNEGQQIETKSSEPRQGIG